MKVKEIDDLLFRLGKGLRANRLQRNDSMRVFAQRLGVSEGTLRAMERGAPTVQIGAWLVALWVLDRLDEMKHVLESRESLLDRVRDERRRERQRASRRRS